MAAVMAAPQLAPRPIAAWTAPVPFVNMIETSDNRPALKQLQQSAPAARTRKERPCDGCRKRKSKCVLQESRRCVLCEFHKQECTFVEKAQPRKRKLDDGSYADAAGKKSPVGGPDDANGTAEHLQGPASVSRTATATAPVRKPFAVDESLSLQRHRHCKLLGHTTSLDASLISLGKFNDKNETQSRLGTLRQVNGTEYFSIHDDADVPIPDDEARALADIELVVGQHGSALIDIYFRNVHPSYPVIQKNAFLDRHRHGDRQFNPPLLAAMYLLALSWWDADPTLSSYPKPDMVRLEYIAISSLTVAMQRPKMSAVQAGLLLLQRAKSSTWTLTVQLVALAQDIGLHLDCTDWSIPPWEGRLRKRLAWALYTQDKWSALMHGRPSHINAVDWAVPAPTHEDFDESLLTPSTSSREDPDLEILMSKGRTIFMQMISLTSIMADVCETFYSQTAKAEFQRAGPYATQLVLNRAKPVQIRLKDWFARLPPECKMDHHTTTTTTSTTTPPTRQLSSTGYLHLAYFATEITIHRRIIQTLDPATLTTSPPNPAVPKIDPYLLNICRSAAKTRLISAMDFINRLTPSHLSAFWFFPSAANFALIGTFGALLMASSPGREEAGFYARRLGELRWSLGVCCRRAEWIGSAVGGLEGCGEMLGGLGEKPEGGGVVRGGLVGGEKRKGKEPFGRIRLDEVEEEGMEEEDESVDYGIGEVMEIDGWEET
ncbi:Fungal specific transcription factor [Friedmanniomyces endolithicus]|uniref:Fungal specific transcription factor n=2 Tax=Friedmanniomyces endolithicus TaxID=329885 RepID=A0AAN6L1V6_9PEZI|nr:Fungal specific transcription factor [Friedmanniomyces endolithicus]KAK1048319.1 Fungal specific transcription factor [Friedmanniomyces endolithicus]